MNSLFNTDDYSKIMSRIEKLPHNAPALWGKMDVSQMLAHCNGAMKVAIGDVKLKRLFIGKLIGKMAKKGFLSEKPLGKNSPTAKSFIITDQREFEKEK